MIKTILAMTSTLSLVCSAVAAPLSADDEAGKNVALQWLQLVDSGDYEHAIGQTSEQIGLQQNWMSYLFARRKPLGKMTNRHLVELKRKPQVHGARTWRQYKVVRFRSSFAGKSVAMEEVVLTKMACCWEVSGYTIAEPEPDRHKSKWNDPREHAGQFTESGPDVL